MNPLVSFIIPIYNSEKYIERLLDNLTNQIRENVEIILVDDGSTDQSADICLRYKINNEEQIKLLTQENKGASSARNYGIRNAKGKYIVFLDSDDFIANDYIETIVDLCMKSNSDIIELDYFFGSEIRGYKLNKSDFTEGIVQYDKYYEYLVMQKSNQPWNKIYKREIIEKNNILYNTSITMGEDLLFTLNMMNYAKIIEIKHKAIYYYYLDNINSLCTNVDITYLDDLDLLYIEIKKSIKNNNINKRTLESAQEYMERSFFRAIGLCILNNSDAITEIKKKVEQNSSIQELNNIKYRNIETRIRNFLIKLKAYKLITKIVKLKH